MNRHERGANSAADAGSQHTHGTNAQQRMPYAIVATTRSQCFTKQMSAMSPPAPRPSFENWGGRLKSLLHV